MFKRYLPLVTLVAMTLLQPNPVDCTEQTDRHAEPVQKRQTVGFPAMFTCLPEQSSKAFFPYITLNSPSDSEDYTNSRDMLCNLKSTYLECVQTIATNPVTEIDQLALDILNFASLPAFIDDLCGASTTTLSSYECLINATAIPLPCGRSMLSPLDILSVSMDALQYQYSNPRYDICRDLRGYLECAWGHMGRECDQGLATGMLRATLSMVQDSCLSTTEAPPESPGTDYSSMTVMAACYNESAESLQQAFDGIETSEIGSDGLSGSFENGMAIYLHMAEIVCERHHAITGCISERIGTSHLMMDGIIRYFLNFEDLEETVTYGCTILPDLRMYLSCVSLNIGLMLASRSECANPELEMARALENFGEDVLNIVEIQSLLCRDIHTLMACLRPNVVSCSGKLMNKLEDLVWRLSTCDPSSKAPSIKLSLGIDLFSLIVVIMLTFL